MKEITILSGKGGAGKTSITAALSGLAKEAVFCDTDVDAADLHLIFNPQIIEEHIFYGAKTATINTDICTNCGKCIKYCRFDAIHYKKDGGIEINPFQCEGCRLCERICPSKAISSTRSDGNRWYISNTRFGKLVHARMEPGEENSGKLVTQVRKAAYDLAKSLHSKHIISDGPPGIGCSTIASISGSNYVLVIIEPTLSGFHDAKRLIELTHKFNLKVYAAINKYDLSINFSEKVEKYLNKNKIELIGKIPFDENMVKAMINKQTIIEYAPQSKISNEIRNIWTKLENIN